MQIHYFLAKLPMLTFLQKDTLFGTVSIALSREVFSALGEQLNAEAFALGTQADTQEQRVLFDVKTGSLLYDADGSGVIAAQHVATLRGSALHALSHEHFEIV